LYITIYIVSKLKNLYRHFSLRLFFKWDTSKWNETSFKLTAGIQMEMPVCKRNLLFI